MPTDWLAESKTGYSKGNISIFKVKNYRSKKPNSEKKQASQLHLITNPSVLEENSLHLEIGGI